MQSYGNHIKSFFTHTFAMCSIWYASFVIEKYDKWLNRTTRYWFDITSSMFHINIRYMTFCVINSCKSYHINNVIMIMLMMIFYYTNFYMFQLVEINFIPSCIECIRCRWQIKNQIQMYATIIGNWYLDIFLCNGYKII